MLVAINVRETREYSLKEDIGEDKTVFVLGHFDTFVRNYLQWKLNSIQKDDTGIIEWGLDILRFGLNGWKNLKDSEGNEVLYQSVKFKVPGKVAEVDVISDECISMLRSVWVDEIADEIYKNNWLTEEQKKSLNSL